MTAKEFLRRARNVDRRVEEATERVDRLRVKLETGQMSKITGMPRGGGEDWTATADKLIELEKRVNARIRDLCALKHAAMDAIDRVDEVTDRIQKRGFTVIDMSHHADDRRTSGH